MKAFGVVRNNPIKLKIIPKKIGFLDRLKRPVVTSSVFVSKSIPILQEFFMCDCATIVQRSAIANNASPTYFIKKLFKEVIGKKCLCQNGKKANTRT